MSLNTLKYTLDGFDYQPSNKGDIKVNISLSTESGSYQYVKELSGQMIFTKEAYAYIIKHGECQKIIIEITEKNGAAYLPIFKGYFTLSDCEIDTDKRIIKVTPKEDTLYNCLLDNIDRKFNFLQVGNVVSADLVNVPELEFFVRAPQPGGETLPYWGKWIECGGAGGGNPYTIFAVYIRESKTTYCRGGEPQKPSGNGWEMYLNNCAGAGWSKWYRRASALDDLPCVAFTETNCVAPCTPAPPAITAANEQWFAMGTIDFGGITYTAWVDWNEILNIYGQYTLDNGRNLTDVINYGLNQFCPALDLQSVFLTDNENPVTGEIPSSTKDIQLHSISDIKSPTADTPATLEEVTLKDILEGICANKLNCFWRVDEGTQRLVVEHYANLTFGNALDLTALDSGKWLKQKNGYSFERSDSPIEEAFDSLDVSIDFTGVPINYDGNPCASGTKSYNVSNIYSEVSEIVSNPSEYPNDGIVIISPESLAPPQSVIPSGARSEVGAITGIYAPNAPMAMANLHSKFWKHYRPFKAGYLNFDLVELEQKPIKKHTTISFPICSLFYFSPNAEIITNLTNSGRLVSASFDPKTYFIELEIIF